MASCNTWFPVPRKRRPLARSLESVPAIELSKFERPRILKRVQDDTERRHHRFSDLCKSVRRLQSVATRAALGRRGARLEAISPTRSGARWRWLLLVFLLLLGTSHYADAQPATNVEAYQTLAVDCLAGVPDTVRAFQLQAPSQMPYLRTALVERWQREGRTVFLADSTLGTTPARLPRLVFLIEESGVDYERAGRRQMRRAVHLGLRYTFLGADGRLLREDACRDRFDDMLRPADQSVVETAAFPESQGEAPRAGWLRRYAQPAVLAAATAVTIYLFFSLRDNQPEG